MKTKLQTCKASLSKFVCIAFSLALVVGLVPVASFALASEEVNEVLVSEMTQAAKTALEVASLKSSNSFIHTFASEDAGVVTSADGAIIKLSQVQGETVTVKMTVSVPACNAIACMNENWYLKMKDGSDLPAIVTSKVQVLETGTSKTWSVETSSYGVYSENESYSYLLYTNSLSDASFTKETVLYTVDITIPVCEADSAVQIVQAVNTSASTAASESLWAVNSDYVLATFVFEGDTGMKYVVAPEATNNLTYSGKEQTAFEDNDAYTLSGAVSATDAGDYVAFAKLKSGYMWSDMTQDVKAITWSIAPKVISTPKAVSGLKYTGKNQVGIAASSLYTRGGTYYAKNAGTYTATVTPKANYCWSGGSTAKKSVSWSIAKLSQPVKVKAVTRTVYYSKVKSKAQTVTGPFSIYYKKESAKTYFTKLSGSSSALSINYYTGKVTVKKGTKKGTYKIKFRVTFGKTTNYNGTYRTVTSYVKVK